MSQTIKQEQPASVDLTITLASLASDTNLLAGRESTAVDNTSNKYLDYLLSGKITTGTTPTGSRQILVYVAGLVNDSIYPDVLDGTDSNETITSGDIRDASLKLAARMQTDTTSDRTYYFSAISVRSLFGGDLPKKFVVFVVHDTAVNLNATAGNHVISVTPSYESIN